MKYLHSMIRVGDLTAALDFFCNKLNMVEVLRKENEKARFTLIFLAASEDADSMNISPNHNSIGEDAGKSKTTSFSPILELTYNWDEDEYSMGRNFGHLAYSVKNIYKTCESLMNQGITIHRPPRDGRMAFIKSPDGISIELLQEGDALNIQEPWASMHNTGSW